MTEAEIQANVMLAVGALPHTRIFRNTVGEGHQGDVVCVASAPRVVTLQPGDIVLRNSRRVTFGLTPGSADVIGWCRGRFLSLEIKTPLGPVRPGQLRWDAAVRAGGGLSGFARSPEDAISIINEG